MDDKSFKQEYINELNLIIELQEAIMSISSNNIEQIHNIVLSLHQKIIQDENPEKFFKNEEEFIKSISSTLLMAAHYRPKELPYLAQLAGKLFESFNGLKEIILTLPLKVEESQWHIAFLYECYVEGAICEDDVVDLMNKYKKYYSSMAGAIYLIFQYFHQVFRKRDPEFYDQSTSYLCKNKRYFGLHISSEFLKIRKVKIDDLNHINENQYEIDFNEEEKFVDTVRYWFPKGSIERIIRDDDLESFKEISTHPDFTIDSLVSSNSIFCYPELFKRKVNYLSLAAFFGSVKIFTYLVQLGANRSLTLEDNSNRLIKFAIAGGNVEIIKQCELDNENEKEVKAAIDATIEYFRFSLFQWIYDTQIESFQPFLKSPTTPANFLFMAPSISFIITAARVNNVKMLLFLLDNPYGSSNINEIDSYGWTPLHYAAKLRNIEAIKLILKCKNLDLIPKSPNFYFIFLIDFNLFFNAIFFIF